VWLWLGVRFWFAFAIEPGLSSGLVGCTCRPPLCQVPTPAARFRWPWRVGHYKLCPGAPSAASVRDVDSEDGDRPPSMSGQWRAPTSLTFEEGSSARRYKMKSKMETKTKPQHRRYLQGISIYGCYLICYALEICEPLAERSLRA